MYSIHADRAGIAAFLHFVARFAPRISRRQGRKYKSLRPLSQHKKLKETAGRFCYDNVRKKKAADAASISKMKKECMTMLFGILAFAILFAQMYFTRESNFYYPDQTGYDYR